MEYRRSSGHRFASVPSGVQVVYTDSPDLDFFTIGDILTSDSGAVYRLVGCKYLYGRTYQLLLLPEAEEHAA